MFLEPVLAAVLLSGVFFLIMRSKSLIAKYVTLPVRKTETRLPVRVFRLVISSLSAAVTAIAAPPKVRLCVELRDLAAI